MRYWASDPKVGERISYHLMCCGPSHGVITEVDVKHETMSILFDFGEELVKLGLQRRWRPL